MSDDQGISEYKIHTGQDACCFHNLMPENVKHSLQQHVTNYNPRYYKTIIDKLVEHLNTVVKDNGALKPSYRNEIKNYINKLEKMS